MENIDFLTAAVAAFLAFLATVAGHRLNANWWRLTRRLPADVVVEKDPAVYLSGSGLPDWLTYAVFIPGATVAELAEDSPTSGRHSYRWAWDKGGWPAGQQHVQVTVIAREDSTILIEGIEAEIVNRSRLPEGFHAIRPVGGAGVELRHVRMQMVNEPPLPIWVNAEGEPQDGPFKFNVSKGEPERFEIVADFDGLDNRLVEWRAILHLIANGRKVRSVVDDGGKAFVGASLVGTERLHLWAEDRWVPLNGA